MKRIFLVLLLLAINPVTWAQEEESKRLPSEPYTRPAKVEVVYYKLRSVLSEKDRIWPATLEAAVSDLLSMMSEEDKKTLRNTRGRNLFLFYRHDERYRLGRGNAALVSSACGYCDSKDAVWSRFTNGRKWNSCSYCGDGMAAAIIIGEVWEALQREKREP